MKNQTLTTLLTIKNRIQNNIKSDVTFIEILENNKIEIEYFANKFRLNNDEALLLAACCIRGIESEAKAFDFNDIRNTLELGKIEGLLYQKQLVTLIEKEFLWAFHKPSDRFAVYVKSPIDILNKEFSLHDNLKEHLS